MGKVTRHLYWLAEAKTERSGGVIISQKGIVESELSQGFHQEFSSRMMMDNQRLSKNDGKNIRNLSAKKTTCE